MPPEPVEPLRRHRLPLVALVDANVFGRSAWIRPIVKAAQDGILIAVWSPLIISEVNRLLTWLRIRRHGGDTSESARRCCSADFKRWYENVAVHFHVIEDRPPLADLWTDAPRDPWDAPIWTAALRALETFQVSGAFVVTDNLQDGPPADARGRRRFGGVTFVHPSEFIKGISWWVNLNLTGAPPPPDERTQGPSGSDDPSESPRPPRGIERIVAEFLDSLREAPES